MNEQQRMQYLEAMGVDMFTPRWVLPGAQASRLCLLPVARIPAEQTGTDIGGDDHPVVRRPDKPVGALVSNLLQTVSTKEPSAPHETAPSPVAAVGTGVDAAAFSLAFWRVHPDVMVVDSRQPKVLPTEALLQSVLAAIGLTQRLPRAEIQSWPMPGGGDRSWHAAREMIQAFLESRLLAQPVRYLLIMGSDAAKAVLGDAAAAPGPVSLDSFACDALTTPSLAELLLQPKQKAQLWRLLAPLRTLVDDSP